jgi:signal transduction histidine kinase
VLAVDGDLNPSSGPDERKRWLPLVLAMLVSLMTGAAILHLDSVERQNRLQGERAAVAAKLAVVRSRLESLLNEPMTRALGVVAHIVTNNGISDQDFATAARVLLKDQHGVRNMVVSRGLVISMTYPLEGNESVIGVDFRSVPTQYASVMRAVEARAPLLQGPVPLIQGGSGLILRNPVFLQDGSFFGMANVVLDIDSVFAEAGVTGPGQQLDIAIRGRDGTGKAGAVIHGNSALFSPDSVTTDIELVRGSWHIAARPKGGWMASDKVSPGLRLMEIGVFLAMSAIAFGAAFHIVNQDRTRSALRAKSEELERSNADLERFAYIASHDLKTPLRNVGSFSQLLARRYKGRLDSDADEFIGFITDGVERMSHLIDDLLDFARVTALTDQNTPTSAQEAVDLALLNLGPAVAEAGATVTVSSLPWVKAEKTQLARLFQNLLDNALKYADPDRPPRISITASRQQPDRWTFHVADNGIGIDPQYFETIFEPFRRLHAPGDRPGTGIGLALCRRLVHRFKGRIWVESEPGQGTTVLFTLPAANPPLSWPV